MKACLAALLASLCLVCGNSAPAQTRRALLIGINTYQPPGTQAEHPAGCTYGRCGIGHFDNLDGSVNDAQSMADVLTSPKFGFHADNVVLLTNPAPTQPRPGVAVLPPPKRPTTASWRRCRSIWSTCLTAATQSSSTMPVTALSVSTPRAPSSPQRSMASSFTSTARWCPPTPTRAASTSATAR